MTANAQTHRVTYTYANTQEHLIWATQIVACHGSWGTFIILLPKCNSMYQNLALLFASSLFISKDITHATTNVYSLWQKVGLIQSAPIKSLPLVLHSTLLRQIYTACSGLSHTENSWELKNAGFISLNNLHLTFGTNSKCQTNIIDRASPNSNYVSILPLQKQWAVSFFATCTYVYIQTTWPLWAPSIHIILLLQ